MNIISAQRKLQKALIAPLAVGALMLTAACGGDDGAEETAEETPEETAEEPTDDAEDAAEDDDAADEGSEDALEGDTVSMDEVEANDTPESCWAVMEDTVYDLTDWIDQHPGGEERIQQLCGTDASDAFDDQHGGQDEPEGQLSEFEIGTLED